MSLVELDWYLVHARPRQEAVAAEHLERQGTDRVRVLREIVGATTAAMIPSGLVVPLRAAKVSSG